MDPSTWRGFTENFSKDWFLKRSFGNWYIDSVGDYQHKTKPFFGIMQVSYTDEGIPTNKVAIIDSSKDKIVKIIAESKSEAETKRKAEAWFRRNM